MTGAKLEALHVLVVDDEPFVLNLTKRMLVSMGVKRISLAENGHEALRIVDASPEPPDVIVCDLNMPGMDGIELVRHLGEQQVSSGLLLVSGADERVLQTVEALARSHDLQVLGSLEKPIKPEPLKHFLSAYDPTHRIARVIQPITAHELEEGLENDALHVVFQPKIRVATRSLVGVEALARWRHLERGTLGPGAFVPLAEELGKIETLTDALFAGAMAQAGEWRAAGLELQVAVNVSVDVLDSLDLPERLVACAEAEGVNPSQVIIAVTESRLMKDPRAPVEVLTRLRLKGIGLSIDDFGTGHSAMETLKRIPFSEVKIARGFVHGATDDPATRAILESSVALGKTLGLTVTADGVETQEDWDLVVALEVDIAQGHFVAEPMSGEELLSWSSRWAGELQELPVSPGVRTPPAAAETAAVEPADTEPIPRKLAAILFADVAGYSRLTGEDEDSTHRTLREYFDLFAARIEHHNGRIAHFAGDAVLAEFAAVVDAVRCATEAQGEFHTRNARLPDERKVQFRIGVNLGDVIADRGDIYGDGVNVAARLEELAEPGGVCISDAVRSALGTRLSLEYKFIGEHRVKNIAAPLRAFHIVAGVG